MINKIVSFDYDKTLSQSIVYEYAQELIGKGFELHIVTARYSDENTHKYLEPEWREIKNRDLWETVQKLGLSKDNVHFTEFGCKTIKLQELNPVFHLDDDEMQLYEIHLKKSTHPISVLQEDWREQCETILNIKKDE